MSDVNPETPSYRTLVRISVNSSLANSTAAVSAPGLGVVMARVLLTDLGRAFDEDIIHNYHHIPRCV